MIIFQEHEIRELVQVDGEMIQVIEDAFTSLVTKRVAMPPIMRIDIPENNGEVDVKSAYISRVDSFAIKVSSGFFDNVRIGLPSLSGTMLLVSAKTGLLEAVLLDNGYLTDLRTAAAGAVAAKYLARENLHTVGVIGAGAQARYQVLALRQVRNFERIKVYGPTQSRVERYAREMEEKLGIPVSIASSPEEVVKESDLVVTTTPSKTPVIQAEWLHPGLHITAMGSDAEHKQELEAQVLKKADLVVCDVKSQCFRLGELHHALEQGVLTEEAPVAELGEITSGRRQGRKNDQVITVCDLTGTGVQDTAIALYARQKLAEKGYGLRLEPK
jgi:ectoine utilization protein EutC